MNAGDIQPGNYLRLYLYAKAGQRLMVHVLAEEGPVRVLVLDSTQMDGFLAARGDPLREALTRATLEKIRDTRHAHDFLVEIENDGARYVLVFNDSSTVAKVEWELRLA